MSYDLNILVINQKTPTMLNFESTIKLQNEIHDSNSNRYFDMWSYMTQANGVWYSLAKEDRGIYNAYLICDSDFEANEKNIHMPYWITDESVKYNLTPLIINKEYRADFEKIIKFLIEKSPVKTIMLLARYQGGEHEIICGVLKFDQYITLLNERRILFNVCYIIKE